MVILAPTGAGKTASLVAWAHALRDAALRQITSVGEELALMDWRYVTGPELAESGRRRRLGTDEPECVSSASTARVLLFDHVSERTPAEALELILDRRYRDGLGSIVCSTLTRDEFSRRFGAAVLRRCGRVVGLHPDGSRDNRRSLSAERET